jgi:hypothetical protein
MDQIRVIVQEEDGEIITDKIAFANTETMKWLGRLYWWCHHNNKILTTCNSNTNVDYLFDEDEINEDTRATETESG